MGEPLWIANRQLFEIVRSELAALGHCYGTLVPPADALDRGLHDLAALASAGLLDGLVWALIADRPAAGAQAPYLLHGAAYRLTSGPPPLTDAVPEPRRLVDQARFRLFFHPTARFRQM